MVAISSSGIYNSLFLGFKIATAVFVIPCLENVYIFWFYFLFKWLFSQCYQIFSKDMFVSCLTVNKLRLSAVEAPFSGALESHESHRMAWVAKEHSAHPVPTPCYVQGRQPAAQAAQSHIQPGLECLQGWGTHSLLGQPIPVASDFLILGDVYCHDGQGSQGWRMNRHPSIYESQKWETEDLTPSQKE